MIEHSITLRVSNTHQFFPSLALLFSKWSLLAAAVIYCQCHVRAATTPKQGLLTSLRPQPTQSTPNHERLSNPPPHRTIRILPNGSPTNTMARPFLSLSTRHSNPISASPRVGCQPHPARLLPPRTDQERRRDQRHARRLPNGRNVHRLLGSRGFFR